MLLTDVGPFQYQFSKAAASLTFTPLADRAALVTRINITQVSATDTWIISCGGKEMMRARIRTTGNQNPFNRSNAAISQGKPNFFDFCRWQLGMDPSIPVPQAQVLTIASLGGATANIFIRFEEHSLGDVSPSMLNHYLGSEFLIPITTFIGTATAVVGVINHDTQISPSWLPTHLIGAATSSAWKIQLLALFFEAVGVNTFSGAANHQSQTNTLRVIDNSRQFFSRTTLGIPALGTASAAGSANSVLTGDMNDYLPIAACDAGYDSVLPTPILVQNGDAMNIATEIIGDATGGADYSPSQALWVARVSRLS